MILFGIYPVIIISLSVRLAVPVIWIKLWLCLCMFFYYRAPSITELLLYKYCTDVLLLIVGRWCVVRWYGVVMPSWTVHHNSSIARSLIVHPVPAACLGRPCHSSALDCVSSPSGLSGSSLP